MDGGGPGQSMGLTLGVVGLVHGDELVSDEVLTSHQCGRDGDGGVESV